MANPEDRVGVAVDYKGFLTGKSYPRVTNIGGKWYLDKDLSKGNTRGSAREYTGDVLGATNVGDLRRKQLDNWWTHHEGDRARYDALEKEYKRLITEQLRKKQRINGVYASGGRVSDSVFKGLSELEKEIAKVREQMTKIQKPFNKAVEGSWQFGTVFKDLDDRGMTTIPRDAPKEKSGSEKTKDTYSLSRAADTPATLTVPQLSGGTAVMNVGRTGEGTLDGYKLKTDAEIGKMTMKELEDEAVRFESKVPDMSTSLQPQINEYWGKLVKRENELK